MNALIDEDDEAETAEFVDTLLKQFVPRLANRIELLNLGGGAIRRADPSTVDNHGGNRATESLLATVPLSRRHSTLPTYRRWRCIRSGQLDKH